MKNTLETLLNAEVSRHSLALSQIINENYVTTNTNEHEHYIILKRVAESNKDFDKALKHFIDIAIAIDNKKYTFDLKVMAAGLIYHIKQVLINRA